MDVAHASAGANGRPLESCGFGRPALDARVQELMDGAVEPELRQCRCLAGPRSEAGAPEHLSACDT